MTHGDSDSSRRTRSVEQAGRVTLRAIAERVGVSTATVSLVVNGRPGVRAETRTRVMQVVDELGFRPNRLAQGLQKGHMGTLGMMLPADGFTNPAYAMLVETAIAAAAAQGYQVLVTHAASDKRSIAPDVEALRDYQVAGVIFTSLGEADRSVLERLTSEHVPFVQVIRRVEGHPADFVGGNDKEGAHAAAKHVVDLGHREVAVLAGPQNSSASAARLASVRDCLATHAIDLPEDRVVECELSFDSGYSSMQGLLNGGTLPTAVITGSDVVALGAFDALRQAGLRVPDDVTLVGYDDIPIASSRLIDLTTVHVYPERVSKKAIEVLLERINDPKRKPQNVVFRHELIVRGTSGALRRPLEKGV